MSQKNKILLLLQDNSWHCTNEFYASFIADPRSRISELKRNGYILEWRWCQQHNHAKSKEWRLIPEPAYDYNGRPVTWIKS